MPQLYGAQLRDVRMGDCDAWKLAFNDIFVARYTPGACV